MILMVNYCLIQISLQLISPGQVQILCDHAILRWAGGGGGVVANSFILYPGHNANTN